MQRILEQLKEPQQGTFQSLMKAIEAIQAQAPIEHVTYHINGYGGALGQTPFVRTTYPDAWVKHYLINNFVKIDPVILAASQEQDPFYWSDLTIAPQSMPVMQAFSDHGLGAHGFTIPLKDQRNRTHIISLNTSQPDEQWRLFIDENLPLLLDISLELQKLAIQELGAESVAPITLTSRQTECLTWAGYGKTTRDTAVILGISEATVRDHLNEAKAKLNAANIAHAVAKAQSWGLISFLEHQVKP